MHNDTEIILKFHMKDSLGKFAVLAEISYD